MSSCQIQDQCVHNHTMTIFEYNNNRIHQTFSKYLHYYCTVRVKIYTYICDLVVM